MDIKVEIVSKERIKPRSTKSPKTHKLSLLDQNAPNCYTTALLFYPKSTAKNKLDSLRVSLWQTLNHMNPLAGRVKDGLTVECNGQGVDFLRAKLNQGMSNVLNNLKIDLLRKLLPMNPLTKSDDNVLLAIQVNSFVCGGLAIGICVSHLIADGSSVATFLNTWASISRGYDNINLDNFFLDCTSIFPPKDIHSFSAFQFGKSHVLPNMAARRFVFDESNISAL